jgi:hypothetical protein
MKGEKKSNPHPILGSENRGSSEKEKKDGWNNKPSKKYCFFRNLEVLLLFV